MTRSIRWLLLAPAICAAGCAETPLSVRYAAERDLWRANRLERRVSSNPEVAGPVLEETIGAYARVIERYPATRIQGDPGESALLGSIRAGATLGLARMRSSGQRDFEGAITVLFDNRFTAPENLEATVRLHSELIRLLDSAGRADSLVLVLDDLAARVPPVDPTGHAIPLVLEAPLRAAEVREATSNIAESEKRLEEAATYYDRVITEHAASPAAVAARMAKANVFVKQQRFDSAVSILEQAMSEPAAASLMPGILYTQATVLSQGLHDHAGAIRRLRRLQREFPEDPRAPGAQVQIGIAFQAAGQPDSALAALADVERRYPARTETVSQALFLAASVLEQSGRIGAAQERYRDVATRYPRTTSGLLAPLQIAESYARAGDRTRAEATLLQAAAEYQRIARELGDDPGSRDVVLAALDHLADVWTRLGRWPDAVQALLTRGEGFPSDYRSPLAFIRAASIQEEQLKDRAAAIATLERVADRYPTLPLAKLATDKVARLRDAS